MKLAAYQPYIFPYLAYWQLINHVDIFVIADELQYVKQSYISRNNILLHNAPHTFTLEVLGVSLGKSIGELEVGRNKRKILNKIHHAYSRAPHFHTVFPILEKIMINPEKNLSKFLVNSILLIADYLDIDTTISYHPLDLNEGRQSRIIKLCKDLNADYFVSAIDGRKLYSKEFFLKGDIHVNFLKMNDIQYKQFNNEFVPNLSIVDVMMFNSKKEVQKLLNEYTIL